MIKSFNVAVCFAVITFHCYGQSDLPSSKKFNHYVGIQANELLRQLFSFSNTNTTVNNPYAVIYSFSPVNSKWGGHAGFGYTYNWINDKNEAAGRVTKVNDLFYRIGVEKKIALGKRFEAGVALDFAGSYLQDKTSSLTVTNLFSQVDSSITEVTDKTKSFGGGPQFSLGFHISEKIIIGTETTLYYMAENKKENITIIDTVTDLFNGTQQVNFSNFNSEVISNGFSIAMPVSIFLIVKF